MNLFKPVTLKWWQVGSFKISMIAVGIAIGATWPSTFANRLTALWLLFAVLIVYVSYVWWKQ